MRVGFVVREPLRDQSGGYLYDRKVVEHLQDSGNAVSIYTVPPDIAKIVGDGLELLIEDELCHDDLLEFNLHLKEASSIPVIAVVHHLKYLESVFQREEARQREREFLRTCDALIANSNDTSRKVSELGISLPTVVAYPGCDLMARRSGSGKESPESFV